MATAQMDTVIRHLRRAVLRQDARTDGQLLASFIDKKDEGAFEALVHRHGPMVFGVCRRVAINYHDAEDAFQATFLVLARRAPSVRPRERVANWLHGVALRTAMKANAMTAKRRQREKQVTEMPEPEAVQHDQWHDLQPLLDQELNGLPENYRLPILLCDLEGKTIKEATQQLGWPQGTLATRLARGRKLLAKRLANRGIVLSAGSLVAVVSRNVASAGVPYSVVDSTIKAASLLAAGKAAATGAISVKVAALTEGVLKAMMMSKLKAVVAAVLILGFMATGATVLTFRTSAAHGHQPPAADAPMKPPQEKDKEKEGFTAWGKEVGGLQAGLGFRPGQKRAYSHGETVTLVVRVRNVGKEAVEFKHIGAFFIENPPTITDADGKRVQLPRVFAEGLQAPHNTNVAPGKEVELYEWSFALQPKGGINKESFTIHGTGKFSLQCERVVGPTSGNPNHPNPTLDKLSTGKLELEVRSDPPPAKEKADEQLWGNAVEGVQVRLSPKTAQRKANEVPAFELDLRNRGQKTYHGVIATQSCEIQVDGKWYKYRGNFPGAPVLPLKPGTQVNRWLDVSLGSQWLEETEAKNNPDKEGEAIRLPPGKHTIRLAYHMRSDKDGRDKEMPDLRVVSNPVEIEVAKPTEEKEGFTAWGKEVGGLQAGLGFRPGQKRAYSHGETVTLVVRVRNVGKEAVTFDYIPAYFVDWPPSVTDGEGKAGPQVRVASKGGDHNPVQVNLAPGKEIELAEVKLELRPASESGNKKENTLYGTGKFQIHYERVMYGSGRLAIASVLRNLGTGKLDLEVKPDRPAEKK